MGPYYLTTVWSPLQIWKVRRGHFVQRTLGFAMSYFTHFKQSATVASNYEANECESFLHCKSLFLIDQAIG